MTSRTCQFCEPRLRAFLDGELSTGETDRVRVHLSECEACRYKLEALTQLSRLLSVVPNEIEPPPHFTPNLQLRLAALRPGRAPAWSSARRPRWSRRYSLAGVTIAATVVALIVGAPPKIGAQDLVGKVQESWKRLQSYSCQFVTEGVVAGSPRRFEQRQWFRKPDLFRLETNKDYPEQVYMGRDTVTTVIPGGRWEGKRLTIIRPRHAREEGLPFPFGAEWPASYDITMDALVRELRSQQGGELLGTEVVAGRLCYGLKFSTRRPIDRVPTHYAVWIDQESFLPLKIKIYHNSANYRESTAVDLQTNVAVPSDTFRYEPDSGTFQVYGEAEPFVFTLGMTGPRPEQYRRDPAAAAEREMALRLGAIPFAPWSPDLIPPGYELVRVRAARGRWLDAYWMNNSTGSVIKLLEQPENFTAMQDEGQDVPLRAATRGTCRWRELRRPAPIQYLSWQQGQARLSLAAAGLSRGEALRMAASMKRVQPVMPEVVEKRSEPGAFGKGT
jgi:outer membrane lipoprotein-sorting protein